MKIPNQLAYELLQQAQQARKAGDKRAARRFAEQAARLAPDWEDPWIMLAALASPHASVAYLEHALALNPLSQRAQQGMAWAVKRLKQEQEAAGKPVAEPVHVQDAPSREEQAAGSKIAPEMPSGGRPVLAASGAVVRKRFPFTIFIILFLLCLVSAFALMGASGSPVVSSLFTGAGASAPLPTEASAATAEPVVVLPTDLPTATSTAAPTATPTATLAPTDTVVVLPTDTLAPAATSTPTAEPTATETTLPSVTPPADETAFPTETPVPTETPDPRPTKAPAPETVPPSDAADGARWIDVDLSNQMVYAFEGNTVVNSFVVSTGTWQTPTVTGQYRIYIKLRSTAMSGPDYYLPNVPYTMYFYKGYALHGTYWHSNFGTPMSHGCVNLTIPDAEWLYNFASVGTLVNVHY